MRIETIKKNKSKLNTRTMFSYGKKAQNEKCEKLMDYFRQENYKIVFGNLEQIAGRKYIYFKTANRNICTHLQFV